MFATQVLDDYFDIAQSKHWVQTLDEVVLPESRPNIRELRRQNPLKALEMLEGRDALEESKAASAMAQPVDVVDVTDEPSGRDTDTTKGKPQHEKYHRFLPSPYESRVWTREDLEATKFRYK